MMISGSSVWVMGPFLKAAQYQMDDGVKQGAMEVMTNIYILTNKANKTTFTRISMQERVVLI